MIVVARRRPWLLREKGTKCFDAIMPWNDAVYEHKSWPWRGGAAKRGWKKEFPCEQRKLRSRVFKRTCHRLQLPTANIIFFDARCFVWPNLKLMANIKIFIFFKKLNYFWKTGDRIKWILFWFWILCITLGRILCRIATKKRFSVKWFNEISLVLFEVKHSTSYYIFHLPNR